MTRKKGEMTESRAALCDLAKKIGHRLSFGVKIDYKNAQFDFMFYDQ